MKIKTTPEHNPAETDEAFALADKLLKKITGLYMKVILIQENYKDVFMRVGQSGGCAIMWQNKLREIIQSNIMDYIGEGDVNEEGWEKKFKMVRDEIGNKSFYDIKLNKFDLEAMNEINRKHDDYAVLLTGVRDAIDKLDKYDYLQTGNEG